MYSGTPLNGHPEYSKFNSLLIILCAKCTVKAWLLAATASKILIEWLAEVLPSMLAG